MGKQFEVNTTEWDDVILPHRLFSHINPSFLPNGRRSQLWAYVEITSKEASSPTVIFPQVALF
jgi:hypothetical protein